ncbi:hypothetical protein G6F68_018040 [Rhizopus microsporus]|nr:hypothetical protein G6F68_018040 [Rhizopus microsporus]
MQKIQSRQSHLRGVKVILEGLSQGQNFVGSIQHPAGNIAELLLSQGYAKCIDWSITLATSGPTPLRNAEKMAKEKKLRLWRNFVAKAATESNEFDASVVRILTGDTVLQASSKLLAVLDLLLQLQRVRI